MFSAECSTLDSFSQERDRNVTSTPNGFPIRHRLVANLTLGKREESISPERYFNYEGRSLGLWFGCRRREVPRLLPILEPSIPMRSIAKRFAGGMTAAAKRDGGTTAKSVWFTFHVDEFDFTLNAQRAVVAYRDSGRWHSSS